jgi:5S rRNA maturation endonuclease (ribonuclease M5)
LRSLPLEGFRYFEQVTRTIADDGLIQVDKRFYAALPLPIGSRAVVRIYENAIEILHPLRMEVVRRHQKGLRPGDFKMEPGDRVFNPSEQTQYLLKQAGRIGPRTTELCQRWFQQEGRPGHRKLYGVINLARKHPAVAIEQAAVQALAADLHSYPAFCRLVERKRDSSSSAAPGAVAQQHQLIRPSADYGTFWNQYASHAEPALPPPLVCPEQAAAIVVAEPFLDRTQLAEIWQRASWRRVIAVLGLEVDVHRHSRAGEIWLKSPFTAETQASLHVDEGRHLFKDFSSGVGGGILQFCQRWFQQQGQPRTIYEVARWMLQEGICPPPGSAPPPLASRPAPAGCVETERLNPVIPVDLRRYLRPDHPHVYERGLSPATCRNLGCGFLPERTGGGGSPLNGRFVFQVRSLRPQGEGLVSVVVGHTGRALTEHQQVLHGKYWAYPFHKGWELYNQDHLLLDPEARRQTAAQGLLLVEGFFDVAALVEAGCRNVVALMGTALTPTQVERIAWLQQKISFTKIQLFLDRDPTGRQGAASACDKLSTSRLTVSVFDWDQLRAGPTGELQPIASAIQDPAEMPMAQLQWLRQQHFI